MGEELGDAAPLYADVHRRRHLERLGQLVRLNVRALDRLVEVSLQRDEHARHVAELREPRVQPRDLGEALRVARVVRVAHEVARVEPARVVKHRRLQLPELLEDQVALLAAGELDGVDGAARVDRRRVGGAQRTAEEGVEQRRLAGARAADDVAEQHAALDARAAAAAMAVARA